MLWSNFILGFKLCFPLFQTHYHTDCHTQKQRKIKIETKDKIELQICIQLSKLVQGLQILLMSGVTGTSASQVLESCWKIWSQVSQRKKSHFQTFQHVLLACITIVMDTPSSCGGPLTWKAQIHDGGHRVNFDRNLPSSCFVVQYHSLILMI